MVELTQPIGNSDLLLVNADRKLRGPAASADSRFLRMLHEAGDTRQEG
jgi:hypothetical protein